MSKQRTQARRDSNNRVTSRSTTSAQQECKDYDEDTAQSYILIWADAHLDERNADCRRIVVELQKFVDEVILCTELAQCIQYINEMEGKKAYVIMSGPFSRQLVKEIHENARVDTMFIFCGHKIRYEEWASQFYKIAAVCDSMKPIYEFLRRAFQNDHGLIPMSFVEEQNLAPETEMDLGRLPPSYMYTMLFKDILLSLENYDDHGKALIEFIKHCQEKGVPKEELDTFQRDYLEKASIWWYTWEGFLYPMLNRSLRTLDMKVMVKMGFFIRSLHNQLRELCHEQSADFPKKFIVYRGQGLTDIDFKHLNKSKDGLLAFNCFLSTSPERRIAMYFMEGHIKTHQNNVAVLFEMSIDRANINPEKTPFAEINALSYYKHEREVLFSMHTVFRVVNVKQLIEDKRTYSVELSITNDDDPQLAGLMEYMKNDNRGVGWCRMGDLMITTGNFDQAEELYMQLLKNAANDNDRTYILFELGRVKDQQGKYKEAIEFYLKSISDNSSVDNEYDLNISATYNSIGLAYNNMGDYLEALKYYLKAHEIKEKALYPEHPDLGTSYSNIGGIYNSTADYSKALEYYEKSLCIRINSLPETHPDVAMSYSNIGVVYLKCGEFQKALECFQQELTIMKSAVDQTHPDIAFTYLWLGKVYRILKEHSIALTYFERSIGIREKSFGSNHPLLAVAYCETGELYRSMGNYERAFEFHRKALNIQQNTTCNPLELATTYIYLGDVYQEIKDYANALIYYEKGLEIRKRNLQRDHPDLAIVFHNLANLYFAKKEYTLASENIKRAIEIAQIKFHPEHPYLAKYNETQNKIRQCML